MSFIGIYTNRKEFKLLKNKIIDCIDLKNENIIRINKQNIKNLKNVRFETIVISKALENIDENKYLEKIVKNVKYLILNGDADLKLLIESKKKINLITYGLNQKSTITLSSLKEENILISLQREIMNIYNKYISMREISVDLKEYKYFKIEDILLIYTIYFLYKNG